MDSIYTLLEQRRDFLRRYLYTKYPAIIPVDSSAEVVHWKLVIGKLLFEQDRAFRWKFVESTGEPGAHSPKELLIADLEIWQGAHDHVDPSLAGRLENLLAELESTDGCLEWRRIAEALGSLETEDTEGLLLVRDLQEFCCDWWRTSLDLATSAPDQALGALEEDGDGPVHLPPNIIFPTRPGLLDFTRCLQPVPQPVVSSDRLSSRVGPIVCGHIFPVRAGQENHSLDFSVLIGAIGVELTTRCPCGAEWIPGCNCLKHNSI